MTIGQIIVDDAQPGDLVPASQLEFEDKLARDAATAQRLAGPVPILPAYLVERGYPSAHIDPATGFIVQDGPTPGLLGDPTAAQQSADYQAELAAWNQRFALIFAELRKA